MVIIDRLVQNEIKYVIILEGGSNMNKDQDNVEILDDTNNKEVGILTTYGENFTQKEYITNPAIGRDEEIKQLILILLTPEKSAILTGKPGVGKTAIVEGLAYRIINNDVPDALKNYTIIKINTASLIGQDPVSGVPRIQMLLNEIKNQKKLILFIDEIHTLIGKGESMDFANIF